MINSFTVDRRYFGPGNGGGGGNGGSSPSRSKSSSRGLGHNGIVGSVISVSVSGERGGNGSGKGSNFHKGGYVPGLGTITSTPAVGVPLQVSVGGTTWSQAAFDARLAADVKANPSAGPTSRGGRRGGTSSSSVTFGGKGQAPSTTPNPSVVGGSSTGLGRNGIVGSVISSSVTKAAPTGGPNSSSSLTRLTRPVITPTAPVPKPVVPTPVAPTPGGPGGPSIIPGPGKPGGTGPGTGGGGTTPGKGKGGIGIPGTGVTGLPPVIGVTPPPPRPITPVVPVKPFVPPARPHTPTPSPGDPGPGDVGVPGGTKKGSAVGGTGVVSRTEYANYLRDQSFVGRLFGRGGRKNDLNSPLSDLIPNPKGKRTFIGGSRANF